MQTKDRKERSEINRLDLIDFANKSKLISIKDVSDKFGSTYITAHLAIKELVSRGLLKNVKSIKTKKRGQPVKLYTTI